MYNLAPRRKYFDRLPVVLAALLAVAGCSRDQQPIADAIKPAQKTMEAAKGVEQTLQKAHESREAQTPKE